METPLCNFLSDLAEEITRFDSQLSLIHFGSSVGKNFCNHQDVDLLLLSLKDYYPDNFNSRLKELKNSILRGENASGFQIKAPELYQVITSFLSTQKNTSLNFIPKFVFGPYPPETLLNSKMSVFLHFKGPVTETQFLVFYANFPFHGQAIISNSAIIKGKFDIEPLNCRKLLTHSAYRPFQHALKIRALASESVPGVHKCIVKLLQNYLIMNDTFQFTPTGISRVLQNEFSTDLSSTMPLMDVKNCFLSIFEKVMSKRLKLSDDISSLLLS